MRLFRKNKKKSSNDLFQFKILEAFFNPTKNEIIYQIKSSIYENYPSDKHLFLKHFDQNLLKNYPEFKDGDYKYLYKWGLKTIKL